MSPKSNQGYNYPQGSVYFQPPNAGCLQISGEHQIDFIQRQTTNDLTLLSPNTTLSTVLTSSAARILDVLTIFQYQENLLALPLPDRAAQTTQFLQSKIFFMDKVEVADLSHHWTWLDLLGPQAPETLQHLGIQTPPQPGELVTITVQQTQIFILGQPEWLQPASWRIVYPTEYHISLLEILNKTAAQLSPQAYDQLRIEAGLPGPASELTEDYTPLETGLIHAVSTTKGCYTGQEVIARQINYDKINKKLVRLKLETMVEPNIPVHADGRSIGTITSVTHSPHQSPLALAILRRPHFEPGTNITIPQSDGSSISAQVLPPSKP